MVQYYPVGNGPVLASRQWYKQSFVFRRVGGGVTLFPAHDPSSCIDSCIDLAGNLEDSDVLARVSEVSNRLLQEVVLTRALTRIVNPNPIQSDPVQHNTTQHNTTQHNPVQSNETLCADPSHPFLSHLVPSHSPFPNYLMRTGPLEKHHAPSGRPT